METTRYPTHKLTLCPYTARVCRRPRPEPDRQGPQVSAEEELAQIIRTLRRDFRFEANAVEGQEVV